MKYSFDIFVIDIYFIGNGCYQYMYIIIVYGMGIDCKDVKIVFYYGFLYNCEIYLQESG